MVIERPRKIKVTVVRKLDMRDIFGDEDVGSSESMAPVCDRFSVGDEFIIADKGCPEGFCPGAFYDIYKWINGMAFGANYFWMKKPGLMYSCCTDGMRPVIFKLERLDEQF